MGSGEDERQRLTLGRFINVKNRLFESYKMADAGDLRRKTNTGNTPVVIILLVKQYELVCGTKIPSELISLVSHPYSALCAYHYNR